MAGVDRSAALLPGWSAGAERAFALWCAEENMVEDYEAPHADAFLGGYEAGREDEYHAYLRSSVT